MAVVTNTLEINDVNLGQFGLQWLNRVGWSDAPEAGLLTHRLPQGEGVFFQEAVESKMRRLVINGTIHGDTISEFNTFLNEIKALLNGSLKVEFTDDTLRFVTGYRTRFTVSDFNPGAIIPVKRYSLTIECPDPRKYDLAQQSIAAGVDCPLGTARVGPIITINGTASDPTTIILREHTLTTTVATFTLAAALGSGESWIINSALKSVTHDDGIGGLTDALADFSGDFPILDPKDADFNGGTFPEFSATAGSPGSLSIDYARTWR